MVAAEVEEVEPDFQDDVDVEGAGERAGGGLEAARLPAPDGSLRIFNFVRYEEGEPEVDDADYEDVPFSAISVPEEAFNAAEVEAALERARSKSQPPRALLDSRASAVAGELPSSASTPTPLASARSGESAPSAAGAAAAPAPPEWARPGPAVLPAGVALPAFAVVDTTPEPRVMDWHGGDVEWMTVDGSPFSPSAAAAASASAPTPAPAPVSQRVRHEAFSMRIVYEAGRTGFEEEKEFEAAVGSVIAGRYRVVDYIGSAAFSSALSCKDLVTGDDVCLKVIKNSKDFLDQSLDEIKLLRYINAQGDADAHNILRLREYFYHREHLFIVTELLKDNLYEFGKYLSDNGHEPFFTLPRIQRIATQTLRALAFIHARGLLHCDLKPENILIKSYSRCEVKIIDFGSSEAPGRGHVQANAARCTYRARARAAPALAHGFPIASPLKSLSF